VITTWMSNYQQTGSQLAMSSQLFENGKQESLANAKGNARQRCMFEGQLQTESKLTNPSN